MDAVPSPVLNGLVHTEIPNRTARSPLQRPAHGQPETAEDPANSVRSHVVSALDLCGQVEHLETVAMLLRDALDVLDDGCDEDVDGQPDRSSHEVT